MSRLAVAPAAKGAVALGCAAGAFTAVFAALLTVPAANEAAADARGPRRVVETPPDAASIGWPWRGMLRRGVRLALAPTDADGGGEPAPTLAPPAEPRDAPVEVAPVPAEVGAALRLSPHARDRDHLWGTPEIVGALERAAARVVELHGNGVLTVGDLSREHGGALVGHRSHRNGRDADLGFYLHDAATGVPALVDRFLQVRRTGEVVVPPRADGSVAPGTLAFDDARNWTFVEALLRDPEARVQYVFVGRHLRERLLDEARRRGSPAWLVARAERVLLEPRDGDPHRDHFHVRVYCADRDREVCRDKEPYWPWVEGLGPAPFSMRDARDWVAD